MAASSHLRLSAVVMSHPARAEAARNLRTKLADLSPRLSADPEPAGAATAMRTAAAAWGMVEDGATHHLVLQDDVEIGAAFTQRLLEAIASRPEAPFALFTEWGSRSAQAGRLAALAGAGWVELVESCVPAPAVVLPAEVARDFGTYARRKLRSDEFRDSTHLYEYLTRESLTPLLAVPNLVDHDRATCESLFVNGALKGPRRSVLFYEDTVQLSPAARSATLRIPSFLPLFCALSISSSVFHSRGPGNRWRSAPVLDWLLGAGWSFEELRARYEEARSVADGLLEPLGDAILFEIWLTAFATGAAAAEVDPSGRAGDAAHSRLAQDALRTLAPGGLRRVLEPAALARFERPLLLLVTSGVVTAANVASASSGPFVASLAR